MLPHICILNVERLCELEHGQGISHSPEVGEDAPSRSLTHCHCAELTVSQRLSCHHNNDTLDGGHLSGPSLKSIVNMYLVLSYQLTRYHRVACRHPGHRMSQGKMPYSRTYPHRGGTLSMAVASSRPIHQSATCTLLVCPVPVAWAWPRGETLHPGSPKLRGLD